MGDTGTNPPTNEEWRARAEAAEAANHRLEVEAQALVASLPADLVVHVREGGGPEDIRATLAVSIAKVVAKLKEERLDHDGQIKTLAADFRRNQDQWQEHTARLEKERDTAKSVTRAYRAESRRQWKAPICAWGCEHPTGVEVMEGAPPKLDCDEATLAEAERRYTEAVKAHALSCPNHPLAVRAAKAEEEVKRVRELINRDRTGLAAGLAAVVDVVKGYWWLADGGWGSHEEKDRTEVTLREEFTNALELVSEICKRHLAQSGNRANAAFHGGPGPAESINLGRVLVLLDRQLGAWRTATADLEALARKQQREVREALKAAETEDPARQLRDQFAAERAALLGMFPNDLIIYAQGGTDEENARKTLATSLSEVLRLLAGNRELAADLQQKMVAINEALDEFGVQHHHNGDSTVVECVQEAMTTLRANLAMERKGASSLDAQAAAMRGVLEMAKEWFAGYVRTELARAIQGPIGINTANAVVFAIDEVLKGDAGDRLRQQQVQLLRELEAEWVEQRLDPKKSWCKRCRTETDQPDDGHPPESHEHAPTCPLFFLKGSNYVRDPDEPKALRQHADEQQQRAFDAEANLQRLIHDVATITGSIPARFVLQMGGVDAQERARATLAAAVVRAMEALVQAEDRALELSGRLDGVATRVSDAILSEVRGVAPADLANLANIARAAVKATLDERTASALMQLQRQLHATEGKLSQTRHMVDEQRALIERMEAKAAEEKATAEGRTQQSSLHAVYLQTALRVANEMLAERLGVESRPHPLGLGPMEMLGAAREADNEEVSRLRSLIWSASQLAGVVSEVVDGMVHVRMPGIPAPPAPAASEPIPMLLWCPSCHARHVDKGELATKPHHTHACQGCGLPWRPSIGPTVGVQFLPGFKDQEPA